MGWHRFFLNKFCLDLEILSVCIFPSGRGLSSPITLATVSSYICCGPPGCRCPWQGTCPLCPLVFSELLVFRENVLCQTSAVLPRPLLCPVPCGVLSPLWYPVPCGVLSSLWCPVPLCVLSLLWCHPLWCPVPCGVLSALWCPDPAVSCPLYRPGPSPSLSYVSAFCLVSWCVEGHSLLSLRAKLPVPQVWNFLVHPASL